MKKILSLFLIISFSLEFQPAAAQQGDEWITFEPENGNGRHIVLISGDDEYRSEEALPMLAKILTNHHGFKTTVLFAIDPETGEIKPDHQTNIPGLENLQSADLMVLFTRFRELPDEKMDYFHEYLREGKPIVAMRTSTHAFHYQHNTESRYAKYDTWSEAEGWEGGFGRKVLGETWINHHGNHGTEGTRGLIDGRKADHPILRGISDIWVPTNVYETGELHGDIDILAWGQSTTEKTAEAPVNVEKPIMPVAWTNEYSIENGKTGRVFTTTMGSSVDFENEDLRRLIVNASYWALDMSGDLPENANVDIVGQYNPTMYGFDDYIEGLRPSDYK
ncbi:ThuA domain-containing protein [soil metagenome]